TDRLLKRGLDGQWFDLFERPENRHLRGAADSCTVAVVDRRGIGRYGFFVAHRDRPPCFYELGRSNVLADLARPLGFVRTIRARGVLAAPLERVHTDLVCIGSGANAV